MAMISWHLNGLRTHSEDLRILVSRYSPFIVCLQETHLLNRHTLSFRGYRCFRFDADDGSRAHGDVALLIHDHLCSQEVAVQSSLQVLCIRVSLSSLSFSVCNIYIPRGQEITEENLRNLISQLPPPFLILGDFNAHSPLWGSARTCPRGTLIETAMENLNLFLLNTGLHTHFSTTSGTSSSIDLAICSPSLGPSLDWTVHSPTSWTVLDDLHGSDHYPCLLHVLEPVPSLIRSPHWIFQRADWPELQLSLLLSNGPFEDVNAMTSHFTDAVIATVVVPRS